MHNQDRTTIIIICIICIFISIIAMFGSMATHRKYHLEAIQAQAVRLHYAEWVTGKDNQPHFQFITNVKTTKP